MSESEVATSAAEQPTEVHSAPGTSQAEAEKSAAVPDEAMEDSPGPAKRRKLSVENTEKLEQRLGGILCCAVCLDLPCAAVYQCTNGHLMCAACFAHLMADARLRDETATCPNCRIEISKTLTFRNLAVEKAVSELPAACRYCVQVYPRHSLQNHEKKLCDDRLTGCKYECIGCEWRGPQHSLSAHEALCSHPARSAADVVDVVAVRDKKRHEQQLLFQHVLELFSYEKITFNDLQLKPYRTDEFVHKLYYETSRFTAFTQQWVVKAYINPSLRDPTQTNDREITYQLIMKSKSATPLILQYMALRGPYGDADISVRVHSYKFGAADDASEPVPLPLADPQDTNRLLSNKIMHMRLVMFWPSK